MSKTKKSPKFNCDINGSIMVTAALRYALGRHTYLPGAVMDWITDYWADLDSNTKTIIVRDVFEYIYNEKRSKYLSDVSVLSEYDLCSWEKFGIQSYWKLDYGERKCVDRHLTSNKNRAAWFWKYMEHK